MTSVGIFSTNYYGWEPAREQAAPITILTNETHPISRDDPRLADVTWWDPAGDERFLGRISASWWGFHPELALPGVDVAVVIGGNFTTYAPDLAERCLAELGDDDLLLMRHPWRDDIADEALASLDSWRWNDGHQDVNGQVAAYLAAGHPRNWGLFHGGMVVSRNTPAMRAFYAAWRAEYCRWSSQVQLSLPVLLRTTDLKWHTWPDEGQWHAQPFDDEWVRWGELGHAA